MTILAIDPSNTFSGYALIDSETCRPLQVEKIPNAEVLHLVTHTQYDHLLSR